MSKKELSVQEVINIIKKSVKEGKSRYAIIKELAEQDVPVAEIAKAGKDFGINYHYAYNVAKSIGKVITKPREGNTSAKIRELLKAGTKPMEIAKELGIRPQFVYNVRRQMIDRGLLTVEKK